MHITHPLNAVVTTAKPLRLRHCFLAFLGFLSLLVLSSKPAHAQFWFGGSWTKNRTLVGATSGTRDGDVLGSSPYLYFSSSFTPYFGGIDNFIMAHSAASDQAWANAQISTTGAKIVYTLTWNPKNNNIVLDPPPPYVVVRYRTRAWAFISTFIYGYDPELLGLVGDGGHAQATCLDATMSAEQTVETAEENDGGYWTYGQWQTQVLPTSGGFAVREFPFQLSVDTSAACTNTNQGGGVDGVLVSGQASVDVEFELTGLDGLRDKWLKAVSGASSWLTSDPSYTRWLPLAFSPTVSSMPFRGIDGNLPLVWGNIHCAYSVGIYREKNPDVNGAGNYYLPPSAGSNLIQNTKSTLPGYVLLDANGDRLTFSDTFQPASDIKSDFSATSSGYTLSNAGPPGQMSERGFYTYKFAAFPSTNANDPQPARLVSIEDVFGNMQVCTYPGGTTYMVVSDLTSGRQLIFNALNGHITEVIAPFVGSTNVYSRTALAWDGAGHLSDLNVYSGVGGASLLHNHYEYEGDSPSVVQQENVTQVNAYALSPAKDAFGFPIRRLASQLVGSTSDYTSDYPVGKSASFTYGTIQQGYGYYGIDSRTNTATDARGYTTQTIYHYADPQDGSYNGAIKQLDTTGPAFTGASDPYTLIERATPDMTRPATSSVTDGLGRAWNSTHHSVSGAVTQFRDPMNHTWTMDWGIDGTTLLSTTDPTNLTWTFNYTTVGGMLTQAVDPSNNVEVAATYNAYGQLETITTPAGESGTTTLSYKNDTGDLQSVKDNSNATLLIGQFDLNTRSIISDTDYSPLGDPLAFTVFPDTGDPQTSAYPMTSLLVWDAAQQVREIISPNGTRIVKTYDNTQLTRSELLSPQGAVLSFTEIQYDSRGRVYRTLDGTGWLDKYVYDGNDNVTALYDARNNAVNVSYGPNNEVTNISGTYAGGAFQYDRVGRVREFTDVRGVKAQYTYDNADRLTQVALVGFPNETTVYTYDNADRPLTVTKANGDTVTYSYSHSNKWLTGVTTAKGGRTHAVTYTYYADGKRQGRNSYVNGVLKETVGYTYNLRGQLDTLTTSGFGTTVYSYDYLGRLLSHQTLTTSGSTMRTEYQYGNTGQPGDTSVAPIYPRRMRNYVNGTLADEFWMVYSFRGELLSVTGASTAYTYTYDMRGNLIGETRSRTVGGVTYSGSSTYTRDAAGNLNAGSNGWTYSGYDNLLTAAPAAGGMPGFSGTIGYTNGLLTTLGDLGLFYDAWGQLIRIERGGSGGNDGSGNGPNPGGGTPSPYGGYLYPGSDYEPLAQVCAELSLDFDFPPPPVPGGGSSGQVIATYTYDPLGRRHNRTDEYGNITYYDYDGDLIIGQQDVAASGGGMALEATPDAMWREANRISTLCSQLEVVGNTIPSLKPATGEARAEPSSPFSLHTTLPQTSGVYSQFIVGPSQVLGMVSGGTATYSQYDPQGNLDQLTGPTGAESWNASGNNWDAFGNACETPGGAPATAPNFPYPYNGSYQDPDLGKAANQMGQGDGFANTDWGSIAREVGSEIASNIPGVGEGLSAYKAITGRDPITGEKLNKMERILEGASLGIPAGRLVRAGLGRICPQLSKFARRLGWAKSFCFTAGTPIQVFVDGKETVKNIEDIRAGDVVLSRDPETGRTSRQKVLSTSERVCQETFVVSLSNASGRIVEEIEATGEHPFFTPSGQVDARHLGVGTQIVTRAGPNLVVAKVERKPHPSGVFVYNFAVEGTHTYFVGTAGGGAWVHNSDNCVKQLEFDYNLPPGRATKAAIQTETRATTNATQLNVRQIPLLPQEPFDRLGRYGRTPNTEQKRFAGKGNTFDHDPMLCEHYYLGDGKGGRPGYQMTQDERETYGKSLNVGRPVPKNLQTIQAQGGRARAISERLGIIFMGMGKGKGKGKGK